MATVIDKKERNRVAATKLRKKVPEATNKLDNKIAESRQYLSKFHANKLNSFDQRQTVDRLTRHYSSGKPSRAVRGSVPNNDKAKKLAQCGYQRKSKKEKFTLLMLQSHIFNSLVSLMVPEHPELKQLLRDHLQEIEEAKQIVDTSNETPKARQINRLIQMNQALFAKVEPIIRA